MSTGPSGPSTPLVAVDTGGTFTDLVLLRDGTITTLKVPSTPADPSQAVLDGLRQLVPEGVAFDLVHGSTVATNALLERRGARVVLVTNRGFEDVIEIGRQNRPQLYALVGHRPPPLVAREDRLGVAGRLGPDGGEIEPLDAAELHDLAARVARHAPDAIAVALLHSYADPMHERAVATALATAEVPVSVSSEIVPEFREYERTSTTVVNAYVAPVVDRYLGRLAAEAGAHRVRIMGSNGGALTLERARREPVHTVLSGPAGGVVGSLAWARRAGHDRVISFDMGGTSTDVSLLPGHALRTREFEIAGQPVAIPVLDIHTVGAGGGSIARVDPGGSLRVGPRSAGAEPGPICYGRGGTDVTVTDAHVWLGRLPADAFLDGERTLDREAIRGPLARLAEQLGTSLEEAAEGVVAVVDAAMERALRVISVERGYDPVEFAVVAFGGAGGLHVAELTERLGAREAIVPPNPGLLSAYGMLASPVTHEVSRTILAGSDAASAARLVAATLDELEADARGAMVAAGTDPEALSVERWIDARYRGQSFELAVPAENWVTRFHDAHRERYGYARPEAPVEAVTVRVVVASPPPPLAVVALEAGSGPPPSRTTEVILGGRVLQARRVRRRDLRAGHRLDGPAVIQEYSGTTWVPPGWTLEVDSWGCLHLVGGR
ncbi:MAG: hydantoinase/oxoprolinase family protein [Gemmatimonadetes bacterium]|nr:hydantoinase/oxoprolinase family protein [Gemmatimonadota bacterium]